MNQHFLNLPKKLLLLLFLNVFITRIYSQNTIPDFSNDVAPPPSISPTSGTCNNTLTNTSPDFVNKYRPLTFWIPTANTPVKTIQIAMHIFTGGNSLTNTPGVIAWLNSVVNQIILT